MNRLKIRIMRAFISSRYYHRIRAKYYIRMMRREDTKWYNNEVSSEKYLRVMNRLNKKRYWHIKAIDLCQK